MIILTHELEISTIYIEKLPAKPTIAISSSNHKQSETYDFDANH